MHRPMYERWQAAHGLLPEQVAAPDGVEDRRPSIWLSYCPLGALQDRVPGAAVCFAQHRLLAIPEAAWEHYRIGGGTVPLWTEQGWLTFYHGVTLTVDGQRRYQDGAVLLAHHDRGHVLARTSAPVFGPETAEERAGIVDNVVFPTAVDPRAGGLDVYYGMADARIGVAHLRPLPSAAPGEVAA